ncbi:MAG: hypothetical protein IJ992_01470 [Lentisphaeria bacterium]|nr:hypothetical protein [Lentisphaeria bacterium]
MLKKILVFSFVLLTGLTLSAGDAIDIAVCSNLFSNAADHNDRRTGKLLKEYFKAELATHSGIVISQNDAMLEDEALIRRRKKATAPTAEYISKLCKDVKASYLCMLSTKRDPKDSKKLIAEVVIYKADGKLLKTVTRAFESVRSSDFVGILLARDTAVAIRGANPVDDANLNRMKAELEKLADEHVKEQIQKNMNEVK